MPETLTMDSLWWVSIVQLPAIVALYGHVRRVRREARAAVDDLRHELELHLAHVRGGTVSCQLDHARRQPCATGLTEMESRLTRRLRRAGGEG